MAPRQPLLAGAGAAVNGRAAIDRGRWKRFGCARGLHLVHHGQPVRNEGGGSLPVRSLPHALRFRQVLRAWVVEPPAHGRQLELFPRQCLARPLRISASSFFGKGPAAHPHGESTPKPFQAPFSACFLPSFLGARLSEAAGSGICVRPWNPRALSLPSRSPGGTAAGSASVLRLRRAPPDRQLWLGRDTR
jgi:hypothetical protein